MKTINLLKQSSKMVAIVNVVLLLTAITSCKKENSNKPEDIIDSPAEPSSYTYSITNFDDGWTSTAKSDWVEVTKGTMKVLLHYPKEGTIIQADPAPLTAAAWNILVAPRYSNIKNYLFAPTIPDYIRAYFASATLTDSTGKDVYVAFFRKGETGWIEFVAPNKSTFVSYFGIDINTITGDEDLNIYNPLVRMAGYNKFAVAAKDLPGKWSNNFASNTYYTNIYTGFSEGMSTYTSSITYIFSSKSYNWEIVAANSSGGQTSFAQAKSSGSFSVINNWQVYCSDIEGKPKTYDAYFSCVKGARFLWLQDAQYPGGGYTPYGRVK